MNGCGGCMCLVLAECDAYGWWERSVCIVVLVCARECLGFCVECRTLLSRNACVGACASRIEHHESLDSFREADLRLHKTSTSLGPLLISLYKKTPRNIFIPSFVHWCLIADRQGIGYNIPLAFERDINFPKTLKHTHTHGHDQREAWWATPSA